MKKKINYHPIYIRKNNHKRNYNFIYEENFENYKPFKSKTKKNSNLSGTSNYSLLNVNLILSFQEDDKNINYSNTNNNNLSKYKINGKNDTAVFNSASTKSQEKQISAYYKKPKRNRIYKTNDSIEFYNAPFRPGIFSYKKNIDALKDFSPIPKYSINNSKHNKSINHKNGYNTTNNSFISNYKIKNLNKSDENNIFSSVNYNYESCNENLNNIKNNINFKKFLVTPSMTKSNPSQSISPINTLSSKNNNINYSNFLYDNCNNNNGNSTNITTREITLNAFDKIVDFKTNICSKEKLHVKENKRLIKEYNKLKQIYFKENLNNINNNNQNDNEIILTNKSKEDLNNNSFLRINLLYTNKQKIDYINFLSVPHIIFLIFENTTKKPFSFLISPSRVTYIKGIENYAIKFINIKELDEVYAHELIYISKCYINGNKNNVFHIEFFLNENISKNIIRYTVETSTNELAEILVHSINTLYNKIINKLIN